MQKHLILAKKDYNIEILKQGKKDAVEQAFRIFRKEVLGNHDNM